MKKQFILLIGLCLSLFTETPAPTQVMDDHSIDEATHFIDCGRPWNGGGIKIANGSWYRYETGYHVPRGWVYGGSYVTSTRRINKSDYGAQGRGYLTVTGKKLKNTDGTWVEHLAVPYNQGYTADALCN